MEDIHIAQLLRGRNFILNSNRTSNIEDAQPRRLSDGDATETVALRDGTGCNRDGRTTGWNWDATETVALRDAMGSNRDGCTTFVDG